MTQEEKARAYDEALERAREIKSKILSSHLSIESCKTVSEYIDTIIPELAESDDERIRKWLVNYFKEVGKSWIHRDISPEQIITYLEKQKEQKPEVLSGEDVMTMCNQILIDWVKEGKTQEEREQREQAHIRFFELYDDYMMQEQSEVDLEKETNNWLDSGPYTVRETTRHFYKLGLKAKEESK